jgi:hypothetical protein
MSGANVVDDQQPDLVDVHFRPFVRALGNLASVSPGGVRFG